MMMKKLKEEVYKMVFVLICKHRLIKLSKAEINPKYRNKIMYECSISYNPKKCPKNSLQGIAEVGCLEL